MLSKVKVHIVIQKDSLFQDYKVKLGGICIQHFHLGRYIPVIYVGHTLKYSLGVKLQSHRNPMYFLKMSI